MPSSPTPNTDIYGERSSRGTTWTIPQSSQINQPSAATPAPWSLPPLNIPGITPPFNSNGLPLVSRYTKYDPTTNSLYDDSPKYNEFKGGKGIRIYEANNNRNYVKFKVTPSISESGSVNYVEESDIRGASSILIYMGSPSRTFSINAKLVSRTTDEAAENFRILKVLRSWRMPNKNKPEGGNGRRIESGEGTPQILILKDGKLLYDVQVIVRSLNIEYNDDSDRIAIENGDQTRMPIILPLTMSLQEIHTFSDINDFDLPMYKTDGLQYW